MFSVMFLRALLLQCGPTFRMVATWKARPSFKTKPRLEANLTVITAWILRLLDVFTIMCSH
jgi:hypothetical protein